jgi:hypothetical protein
MSSPFVIEQTKNNYLVTWPGFYSIHGNTTCYNLLKVLFDQIEVDEAMLLLNGQHMVTISSHIWYSGQGLNYSEWLMSRHSITGAIFKQEKQSLQFLDILEKRLIWHSLGGTWA